LEKHLFVRHREERSDMAIQKFPVNQYAGLPRCARNDGHRELFSGALDTGRAVFLSPFFVFLRVLRGQSAF
jgi:hypothetical protein